MVILLVIVMISLLIKYLMGNKRKTVVMILGVSLASMLLISIGFLFSSFRQFMIDNVKKEIGDFHVIVKAETIVKNNDVLKIKYHDNQYFITYKNIYDTYKNTKKICANQQCQIIYNDSLLSLYGISKGNVLNLFKKIIFFIVLVLAVAVFFIIYNSFLVSLTNQKKDIFLLKAIGTSNNDLYKMFFLQGFFIGIGGIGLGFVLAFFLSSLMVNLINKFLYEILNGQMYLSIYLPFVFIPFLFMLLIVLLSSCLPLRKLKKYKVMDLFRDNDIILENSYRLKRPLIFSLALINFKRNNKKYKSLIICIFVFVFLFNISLLIFNYTFKAINDYVIVPKYDLELTVNMDEYARLNKTAKMVNAYKKNVFKMCFKDSFLNNNAQKVLVTNLGGNKVINKVDQVKMVNKRLKHETYQRFKKNYNLVVDNNDIKYTLTNNIPFGFETLLKDNYIILSLNDDDFDSICESYYGKAFLKTHDNGLDKYLKNMDYVNEKKSKEITNNIFLLVKIFVYGIIFLVLMITITTIVNVAFMNINVRRREFSILKSMGFTNGKMVLSLCLESLIIAFKGWLYAVPFVILTSKYLYLSVSKVFEIKMINCYNLLFISFVISFLVIFMAMVISHYNLKDRSLINSIKSEII